MQFAIRAEYVSADVRRRTLSTPCRDFAILLCCVRSKTNNIGHSGDGITSYEYRNTQVKTLLKSIFQALCCPLSFINKQTNSYFNQKELMAVTRLNDTRSRQLFLIYVARTNKIKMPDNYRRTNMLLRIFFF